MASYIGRRKFLATLGARSRREAANQPMRGLVTAISYTGRHDRHVAVGRPSDRQHERRWPFCVACSVAAVGLVFLTGTAVAGAILRIELRSSRHFRFGSRRRWAASEKVWIVEETFDCVGKRAGSHTPAVPTGLRY
jgi:hypothetical protein